MVLVREHKSSSNWALFGSYLLLVEYSHQALLVEPGTLQLIYQMVRRWNLKITGILHLGAMILIPTILVLPIIPVIEL